MVCLGRVESRPAGEPFHHSVRSATNSRPSTSTPSRSRPVPAGLPPPGPSTRAGARPPSFPANVRPSAGERSASAGSPSPTRSWCTSTGRPTTVVRTHAGGWRGRGDGGVRGGRTGLRVASLCVVVGVTTWRKSVELRDVIVALSGVAKSAVNLVRVLNSTTPANSSPYLLGLKQGHLNLGENDAFCVIRSNVERGKLKDAATRCVLRPVDASNCACGAPGPSGQLIALRRHLSWIGGAIGMGKLEWKELGGMGTEGEGKGKGEWT